MASTNEVIFDILSTVEGAARISDDVNISNEHIRYLIINNRALILRNELNKGRSLSDNNKQTLSCVPVTQVDISSCPCSVPTDCTVYRTSSKIPAPLELYQKDYITRVSGVDITGPSFSFIPYARASRAGSSKWTKDSCKAFLHDGYIYLLNAPIVQKIMIQGVFEDFTAVGAFNTCAGTPCYTDDSRLPLSVNFIPLIKDLILKDLKIQISVPSDQKGDESQKVQPQNER